MPLIVVGGIQFWSNTVRIYAVIQIKLPVVVIDPEIIRVWSQYYFNFRSFVIALCFHPPQNVVYIDFEDTRLIRDTQYSSDYRDTVKSQS